MASLTPEVITAMLRLVRGEEPIKGRPKEELYELAEALIHARDPLADVLSEINDQGDNFAKIGVRLGIHEATAARWAKPPAPDKRRKPRVDTGE